MKQIRDILLTIAIIAGFYAMVAAWRRAEWGGNYGEALKAACAPVPGVRKEWLGKPVEQVILERGDNVDASIELEGRADAINNR